MSGWSLRQLSILVAFSAFVSVHVAEARGDIVHVWLLAGQSNMVGAGHVNDLPPGFPIQQHDVWYTQDVGIVPAEGWGPLQPRLNDAGTHRVRYGSELTFGRAMADSQGEQLALIKFAEMGPVWRTTGARRAVRAVRFMTMLTRGWRN